MSRSWYERNLGNPAPRSVPGQQSYPTQQQVYTPSLRKAQQQEEGQVALENGDILGATAAWKGGIATRTENQQCPQCNSQNYFTRLQGSGTQVVGENGTARAASTCFDCNYNGGLYDLRG